MIIIAGSLHVDPMARDEYLTADRGAMEVARSAPGCLDFVLAPDPLEPGRINVFERWESDDDLARFRSSDPAPDQPEQTVAVDRDDVFKYRISATEAP